MVTSSDISETGYVNMSDKTRNCLHRQTQFANETKASDS